MDGLRRAVDELILHPLLPGMKEVSEIGYHIRLYLNDPCTLWRGIENLIRSGHAMYGGRVAFTFSQRATWIVPSPGKPERAVQEDSSNRD